MAIDSLLPEEDRTSNHFSDAQQVINDKLPVLLAYAELISSK